MSNKHFEKLSSSTMKDDIWLHEIAKRRTIYYTMHTSLLSRADSFL